MTMTILTSGVLGTNGVAAVSRARASKVRMVEEAQPWHLRRILGPHLIGIEMTADSCTGLKPPRVVKLKISEFRRSTFITAVVRREEAGDCLDEERFVRDRVHLEQRLGGRKLYDGSTTPPTRRWPE
jgi:hypothetical protein